MYILFLTGNRKKSAKILLYPFIYAGFRQNYITCLFVQFVF